MNLVQDLGAVVSFPALITDTNGHILQDNPTIFVSENFPFYDMLSYLAIAVFASVTTGDMFLFFRSHRL
jgi:hypothetical protein